MSESSWLIRAPQDGAGQMQAGNKKKHTNRAVNFAQIMARQGQLPPSSSVGRNFVLAGRSPSDLMRMQTFNQAQSDLQSTKDLSGMMHTMHGSTLDLARSMAEAKNIRAIAGKEAFVNYGLNSSLGDFVKSSSTHSIKRRRRARKAGALAHNGIGKLSAQFESGSDGIAAIGYDGTGGTSYGKYQIASKVGTMTDFLKFLDSEAPDLAKRLRNSGPANTGSRHGAMPDTWRAIASEDPERFEDLQESFAKESHYQPAVDNIVKNTGLEEDTLSEAMREVIWSTAIQHGPTGATRIFTRADSMSGSSESPAYERNMINNVYKIRAGQFGSSTEAVRAAVQNRFKKERVLALNMLDGTSA